MFKLPPFRSEALLILVVVSISIVMLVKVIDPGKPLPTTVPSALLMALFCGEWVVICWGALFSSSIRDWLFEPSAALEQAALGLLIGGILAGWMMGNLLYRAWELWQIAPKSI
jgi:hypothetical protein